MTYSALIRTFNSAATLPALIDSLKIQIQPPDQLVVVDSGSTDGTLPYALSTEANVVHYKEKPFNYSEALNQGIKLVTEPYTLVVSSHVRFERIDALSFAVNLLDTRPDLGAAYFAVGAAEPGGMAMIEVINMRNFTGFNGAMNYGCLYRTNLLRERGFIPEVWAAEDMEWSAWLFGQKGMGIARIRGSGVVYDNPRGYPFKKRLNEELAVAMFVKPEHRKCKYLARVAYRVVRPVSTMYERRFNLRLLWELLMIEWRRMPPSHYYGA